MCCRIVAFHPCLSVFIRGSFSTLETQVFNRMMKVLAVTNLYPNAREPGRGIFNKQQFDELSKLCELKIIAPTPWRLLRRSSLQEGRKTFSPFRAR